MRKYSSQSGSSALPLLCALVLGLTGAVSADDCEAHLGLVHYAQRMPFDSLPMLPVAFETGDSRLPIGSGAMKMTTVVQGITFDSNYDNGSLYSVTSSSTNTFNLGLFVEDSIEGLGTRKYQFRFKMSGMAGRTVTLNIDHSENPYPFISINGGITWRRLTPAEVPSSTQLLLTFSAQQNDAELAFFEPLGYREIHDQVNALVMAGEGATTEVLGLSHQGRQQWLVSVTDTAFPDVGKKRVWVHARAHAGEVTSSHVMLGFLDQVTTETELGRHLRRHCIFHILPCLNVDGTYLGLTRWDSQGIDPERQWGNTSRIPEVANIRARVDQYMATQNPIEVCLNLHSTVGNFSDTFFFKHIRPSVTSNFETIQQRYINAFNNATPLFNNLSAQTSQLNSTIFIESYLWNNWRELVMAMTHEGHYYRRITDNAYITGTDYQQLGRAQAAALDAYFSLPASSGISDWLKYVAH